MDWVSHIYDLSASSKSDAAIDILFQHIDGYLSQRDYHSCDEVLRTLDVDRLDTNLLVASIVVTQGAESHLPYLPQWTQKVRDRLYLLVPDSAERLLAHLIP